MTISPAGFDFGTIPSTACGEADITISTTHRGGVVFMDSRTCGDRADGPSSGGPCDDAFNAWENGCVSFGFGFKVLPGSPCTYVQWFQPRGVRGIERQTDCFAYVYPDGLSEAELLAEITRDDHEGTPPAHLHTACITLVATTV